MTESTPSSLVPLDPCFGHFYGLLLLGVIGVAIVGLVGSNTMGNPPTV